MSDIRLDEEEKALLSSYENDEWKPVSNFEEEKGKYQVYAQATFKKDRRVNIRISSKNLEALQQKALEEGIPYQTLKVKTLQHFVLRDPVAPTTDSMIVDSLLTAAPKSDPLY